VQRSTRVRRNAQRHAQQVAPLAPCLDLVDFARGDKKDLLRGIVDIAFGNAESFE
jgi:hypothetical protein